ncbi:MAG: nitroreductase family protein [Kiloniellaceae bacterium]
MTAKNDLKSLADALAARFRDGADIESDAADSGVASLARMAARGSQRRFSHQPVAPELLRLLSAVALSAPTKSDLQQRDIILVSDPALRSALNALIAEQAWTGGAPALLVFCGNNRRQRWLHRARGRPFANDHLDAFFNAAVDAGIALATYVSAAEAAGLGCCPISAIRNDAEQASRLLKLPEHVFPVAGLAVGWPAAPAVVTPRLPLSVTLHENHYGEENLEAAVAAYDRRRSYARQRDIETFGEDPAYGWSEDKARQYAKPERAGFGAFVRQKGFRLD